MSISHRTNRLKLVGQPSVEQLQNGRYRLTVKCTALNTRNDWYSANKDRIFPDYGSLQSAEMSIDGLAAREGEAYTDMRLTKVESGNRSMRDGGDYLVVLTYETLGSAFVQVKDDTTDYELNGLRRVTRTSIAEAGTDYAKTVGTSFINHQINNETAVRCYLASYSVDDNDSFRQVQEVYVEAGILSETLDNVGSQKAKVIETIGTDPITPPGYLLASKRESDIQGIKTNQFTFLKNGAVISESRAMESEGVFRVTKVFFNSARTTVGPIIAQRTDNVDGMPTISITTLQDADGNSIVDGGENLVNQVSGFSPFSYPGVLNVERRETTNNGGGDWLQVKGLLINAPAQCKVRTTTYFIFQTSSSIKSSDYNYRNSSGLWSPNHWAAFSLSASGSFDEGLFSDSATFRGYRTSSASQSGTLSGPLLSVAQLSWQGKSVLVDNETITYDLVVDQGPVNPIGNTYTLDVQITPAFDDIDGNKYYKKTIVVTDAIPSQPDTASLPYT